MVTTTKENNSWSLLFWLILSSGLQDSYTFCTRDHVLANAQTGNVVFFGQQLFSGNFAGASQYLLPIIIYGLGIFVSIILKNRNGLLGLNQLTWRKEILVIEILFLSTVAFLPQQFNHLANMMVSFSCGLQVYGFGQIHNNTFVSTTCTGNLKRCIEALMKYFDTKNKEDLATANEFILIILVFALGSGLGYVLSNILGLKAILVSSLLLIFGFIKESK